MSASPTLKSITKLSNLKRAARKTIGIRGDDVAFEAESAQILLRKGLYQPGPVREFSLKGRRIATPVRISDVIVSRAIHEKLCRFVDPFLHEQSYAFRPGRSIQMAARRVSDFNDEGYRWCLGLDIVDFFGCIDFDETLCILEQMGIPPDVTGYIRELQTQMLEGVYLKPHPGNLDQGLPLSPMLSNLAIDFLDRELDCKGCKFVRFADDLILLGRIRQECLQYEKFAEHKAAEKGFRFNPRKRFLRNVFQKPIEFLGFEIRCSKVGPSQKNLHSFINRLHYLPGNGQKIQSMRAFVNMYGQFKGARHRFKVLDSRLKHLYPAGHSLADLHYARVLHRRYTKRHTKSTAIRRHPSPKAQWATRSNSAPPGCQRLARARGRTESCPASWASGIRAGGQEQEKARTLEVIVSDQQYDAIRIALKLASDMSGSKKSGHNLSLVCMEFICNNIDKRPERWDHLRKLEHRFGIKLVAFHPTTEDVVFGGEWLASSLDTSVSVAMNGPTSNKRLVVFRRAMRFTLCSEKKSKWTLQLERDRAVASHPLSGTGRYWSGQYNVVLLAKEIVKEWVGESSTEHLLALICEDFWLRNRNTQLDPGMYLSRLERLYELCLFAFRPQDMKWVYLSRQVQLP